MATRVGWDFAKRSQRCPNQSLGGELSKVFAYRKWYSLTPKAGMCRTGPQSSEQWAIGDRQCVSIERDSNTCRSNPDPERWGGMKSIMVSRERTQAWPGRGMKFNQKT
jgi:hypothetical protein